MAEAGGAKVWILAFLAAAGLGFGALVGVGCALGANACPFRRGETYTGTDGRRLFEANCAVCHGLEGAGTANAPPLTGGPTLALEELRAKIGRGRPLAGMPSFRRTLTPEQIAAVARYVLDLRRSDG